MAWLLPIVPAAGGVATWWCGRRDRRLVALIGCGVMAVTMVIALWAASGGATATSPWGAGLGMTLAVTGFARVMAVLVPAIALPVVLYAAAAEADDPALPSLGGLLVVFVAAMELLVIAADLLTLLVGWELVGAISWTLIGHQWRDADRPQRAAHAFTTTRFGDVGLYLAAGAAFSGTAGHSLAYVALPTVGRPQLDVVAAGLLLAAAAKSAQLPFAPWLFSAMAGPTPVSALLHSATMVAAGAYALIRVAPAFATLAWFAPVTVAIGLTTAIVGGVVAFVQSDFKKALAASTSAQYGLMFVAVGAGSVAAAGGQLVTQAAFKALLFLGAGIAIHAVGSGELAGMRLGRALPGVAVLVGIGNMALASIPPLGAARTKEAVLAAAAEYAPWAAAGVLVAATFSVLYAGRIQLLAYGPGGRDVRRRPRRPEIVALALLAVATLGLSALWLPGGTRVMERLGGSALAPSSTWELPASIATIVAAIVALWWLDRRDMLATLRLRRQVRTVVEDWVGLPAVTRRLVVEPTLGLARVLAAFDDRVVDAGVRATAAAARGVSRAFSRWSERGIDGVVWGVAGAVLTSARQSRAIDERGIDGAVEAVAAGIGEAGTQSRRLQTGLTQHYYVIIAIGAVVLIVVEAVWR